MKIVQADETVLSLLAYYCIVIEPDENPNFQTVEKFARRNLAVTYDGLYAVEFPGLNIGPELLSREQLADRLA